MKFSQRSTWPQAENRLTLAARGLRAQGVEPLDLCETNPTRVGLAPDWNALRPLLDQPLAATYAPEPLGLFSARVAVAQYLGHDIAADHIVISASTSELYSWIFKICCDPGDEVLVPSPSYPLLEYLGALESLRVTPYPSAYVGGQWVIDRDALRALVGPRTRALLLVTPNNPTGAVPTSDELVYLEDLCTKNAMCLIADEVFASTRGVHRPLQADAAPSCAGRSNCLTFTLSGLSKVCLLPQLKLGWMVVSGPDGLRREAMRRLEIVADAALSVATPVQLALPDILRHQEVWTNKLMQRLTHNQRTLQRVLQDSAVTAVPADGGWMTLLRTPDTLSDEERALDLLRQECLLVQPGYYYDLAGNGWLVVSLLQPEPVFAQAAPRLARRLARQDWAERLS